MTRRLIAAAIGTAVAAITLSLILVAVWAVSPYVADLWRRGL